MNKREADYLCEVWRHGGNPDAVDLDDVPEGFDWVWDEPMSQHIPAPVEGE